MRRETVVVMGLVLLVVLAIGRDRPVPASGSESSVKDLAARVEALEKVMPDQAHIMADVSYHYGNLRFAGHAENWPLADFHLGETKSHLRWAVRAKPFRKDNQGREIDLGKILEAFENGQLTDLKQAIDKKDGLAFERTYKEGLMGCYSCHTASDKPYLRPQVPTEPETRIINFDPKADWPR